VKTLLDLLRGLFAAWRAGGVAAAQAPTDPAWADYYETPAPQPASAAPAVPEAPVARFSGVTAGTVQAIMPHLSAGHLAEYLPWLNGAMVEFAIDTPLRIAAFLAQLAHESGELTYMQEIASGAAYEGRADLGNFYAGDGVRYKGRGPIQLTGRANYRACGAALGLDLEGDPAQAATPQVGFRVAGWYWTTHPATDRWGQPIAGCNALADAQDFTAITRAINGGLNGLASREAYYAKAREVLGA